MIVLGIESTAHTFGIGVVECSSKEILVNVKHVFKSQDCGMDPRKLTEFHIQHFQETLQRAMQELEEKGYTINDIELVAFSQGPGLGNALKVGCLVAKTVSKELQIPLIGVNHIQSHYEIGKMISGFEDPLFVNITGVNSQVAGMSNDVYVVYGETEDIGLGNCLDSCARVMGLGFPGGPLIDSRAKSGKQLFDVPYTIKGMNVVFSGVLSYVKQRLKEFDEKEGRVKVGHDNIVEYVSREELIDDLCFSLVETLFAMVQEVAKRALCYTQKKQLVLVGGVASSKRFCEMTELMCKSIGVKYVSTPLDLCMDNGVMIAWLGYLRRHLSSFDILRVKQRPYITVEVEPFVSY